MILGAASQLPWIVSCTDQEKKERLQAKISSNLQAVLNILLPPSNQRPGALDFFADKYILSLKDDPQIEKKGYEKMMDKFMQLDKGEIKFYKLDSSSQKTAFDFFLKSGNENWASQLVTYCFEAMLCHPVYKVNPNEIGNQWLNHTMGVPEPTPENKYPEILTLIRES